MSGDGTLNETFRKLVRDQLRSSMHTSTGSGAQLGTVVSVNDDGTVQVSLQDGTVVQCNTQYSATTVQGMAVVVLASEGGLNFCAPTLPSPSSIPPTQGQFFTGGGGLRFATWETIQSWRFQDAGNKKMYRYVIPNNFPGQPAYAGFSPNGRYFAYAGFGAGEENVISVLDLGSTLASAGDLGPNLFTLKTTVALTFSIPVFGDDVNQPGRGNPVLAVLPANDGKSALVIGDFINNDGISGIDHTFVFYGKGTSGGWVTNVVFEDLATLVFGGSNESFSGNAFYGQGDDVVFGTGEFGSIFDSLLNRILGWAEPNLPGAVDTGGTLAPPNAFEKHATLRDTLNGSTIVISDLNGPVVASGRVDATFDSWGQNPSHGAAYNVVPVVFFDTSAFPAKSLSISAYVQQNIDPPDPSPVIKYSVLTPPPDLIGIGVSSIFLSRNKNPDATVIVAANSQFGFPQATKVYRVTYDDNALTIKIGAPLVVSPDQTGDAKFTRENLGNESFDILTVTGNGVAGTR